MPFPHKLLLTVGGATAANVIGRAVNLFIPLAVVGLHGADTLTDRFFMVMAVGLFFHATLANAVTELSVPLIVSGRLSITRPMVLFLGGGFGLLSLGVAGIALLFIKPLTPIYAAAIALMAGAGLANGLTVGAWNAAERYILPGVSWILRLIPLLIYFAWSASAEDLVWLALGIGIADWLRCGILMIGHALRNVATTISLWKGVSSNFATILLAALISGLNPLVDRAIAGLGGAGDISVLEAGERIFGAVAGLATIGLMSVLLTRLSMKNSVDQMRAVWPGVLKKMAFWSSGWLTIGALIGFFLLQEGFTRFTLLTAAQNCEAQKVYWAYLAGLPTIIFMLTYVKRLQASVRLKVLLYAAGISVGLNIVLSIYFRHLMGVTGVALATTIVNSIILSIFCYATHRNSSATIS